MLSVPVVTVALQRLYYKKNSVVLYLPVSTSQNNLSKNNYIYIYSEILKKTVIVKTSEKPF